MVLVEDPQAATIRRIVEEAAAQLSAAARLAATAGPAHSTAVHITAYAGASGAAGAAAAAAGAVARHEVLKQAGPVWVSPAPVSIKMRLFCLPYAGGVSENVFAR